MVKKPKKFGGELIVKSPIAPDKGDFEKENVNKIKKLCSKICRKN